MEEVLEKSCSNEGSDTDNSEKLTAEQEEYYKLMMEHMALEMADFKASRKEEEKIDIK